MVRISLDMPKVEFDQWVIQMRKRVHRLKNDLNKLTLEIDLAKQMGATAEVPEKEAQRAEASADLMIMEPMLTRLKAAASLPAKNSAPYVEPIFDHSERL